MFSLPSKGNSLQVFLISLKLLEKKWRNSCDLVFGKDYWHILARKENTWATENRQDADLQSRNTLHTNTCRWFKSTARDWTWFVCIVVFSEVWVHSAGLYSLSCPPHPPRLLQWPRSPPFPSWQAGKAAVRTAPVCPSARRSSARTPWRAPGPLQP